MKRAPVGTIVLTQAHLFGGGQVRLTCPYCHQGFDRSVSAAVIEPHLFRYPHRCPHCKAKAYYVQAR